MTAWGVAGGYTAGQLDDLAARGLKHLLIEAEWSKAEPSEGRFDLVYLGNLNAYCRDLRTRGFSLTLNYGMHHAPAWLLAKPGGRHVSADGLVSVGDAPDFITHPKLRVFGERYTSEFLSVCGNQWEMIRVGGGHWGELTYPEDKDASGRWSWWGYGPLSTNPVKGWKPGTNDATKAGRYLTWYLSSLANYGVWQCNAVRRQYAGTIALLLPSFGMRPGDFDKAVAGGLTGHALSSPEINGEVQRGLDHRRCANAIATGANVALWCTYAERQGLLEWFRGLADSRGLKMAGENSGNENLTEMQYVVGEMKRLGGDMLMYIRAESLYNGAYGPTIHDYSRAVA